MKTRQQDIPVNFALIGSFVVLALSVALAGPFQTAAFADSVIRVEVSKTADGWQLLRGGTPYLIKGVGGTGSKPLLAQYGGNSIRTWGSDTLGSDLEEAQRLGMTVTAGIWLGHKQNGFDYHNAKMVKEQFERVREIVRRYRNHPALLIWGVGNEMEIGEPAGDATVWQAVEDIAVMIKKEDPNHPTMTVVAEVGGDKISQLHKLCPDIDIVGINSYAGGPSVGERYKQAGGTKPYVLTEFGPLGQWEMGKSPWGAVFEINSTEKMNWYRNTYEKSVLGQKGLCFGSYAFTWGYKREASASWYGMFLSDGSKVGAVDVMSELWTGKPVTNPCPRINSLKFICGNDPATTGATVKVYCDQVETGATVRAHLDTTGVSGDPIKITWELHRDWFQYGGGGDAMPEAEQYPEAIVKATDTEAELKMPMEGGGYRLYAYVRSEKGGSAVANLILYAKGPLPKPKTPKATLPFVILSPNQKDPSYFPSGWIGNGSAVGYAADCTIHPRSGTTCMKLEYRDPGQFGGIVWQNPANDWGDKHGGFNLTGAQKLTVWSRGEKGGEKVEFSYGGIMTNKPYCDSSEMKLKVKLTKEWEPYTIDLTGKDLTRIKSGFGWRVEGAGKPVTFYIDDVRYE